MIRPARLTVVAFLLASSIGAQITLFGSSTPAGFAGIFDTSGQIPFAGNANFRLSLHNHANPFGGAIGLGFGLGMTQVGAATILVDLNGIVVVNMPAGTTSL